jgi:hypothetical protein
MEILALLWLPNKFPFPVENRSVDSNLVSRSQNMDPLSLMRSCEPPQGSQRVFWGNEAMTDTAQQSLANPL